LENPEVLLSEEVPELEGGEECRELGSELQS